LEKEKFISKLNIKDYNNQLEKILSKKPFTEDTKNLLLNMLYKIENAYSDYSLVNKEVKSKKETLEEILDIISNDCEEIDIIREKQSKVDIQNKKITTYLNTKKMLYEIYQISASKFKVLDKYEIEKNALEMALNQGYSISMSEMIRDFDGWSWNIAFEEIENLKSNLIYKTLKILVGYEFLENLKRNEENDVMEILINRLTEMYGQEFAEEILKLIVQISIINIINENSEEKERLINIQNELEQELLEMENMEEYIAKIEKKKKDLKSKIKKIEKKLDDDKLLKEEFIARNQVLDMNNRIFSLSDLSEILEKEKENLKKQIDEYTNKQEPMKFLKAKSDLEKKFNLLKEIELQNTTEKIYNTKVKELLKRIIKTIKIQNEKAEEKEEQIKLIYIVRYFSLIYVKKNKQVKDIIDTNQIQRIAITKACNQKIINIFSKDVKENYEIIKNIFNTDIIELEKVFLKFIKQKDNILLEIYDEENKYKTIEFEDIKELNVKLNKKIKVFT